MTAQFYPKQVDYIDKLNALYNAVTAAITASGITNVPAGNISATNVQAAINELDTEKQPLDATLTALAAVVTSANKIIYATASDTFSTLDLDTDGTLTANSDTKLASQKAVKTYVDASVVGLFDLRGATDASTNPNYPAASKADIYVVSVAGKVGGASGVSVDIGDMYLALADNAGGTQASVGTSWVVLEHNLVGALLSANNLSDITSASSARTNLGLGTLATQNGTFSGTSSGTNTGDQTITLTGGVTGSGTSSFVATVITNANLTGPITSVGNATSIASQTGTGTTFAMSAGPTFTGTVGAAAITASGIVSVNDTLGVTNASFPGMTVTRTGAAASVALDLVDGSGNIGRIAVNGGTTTIGLRPGGVEVLSVASTGTSTTGTLSSTGAITALTSNANTFGAATGSGKIIIGNASPSSNSTARLQFINSNTVKNWSIGSNDNAAATLEFTPSTANGGSTFSTPTMSMTAGAVTVTGNLTTTGTAVIGGTSTILSGLFNVLADGSTANQMVLADSRAYNTANLESRQMFTVKYTSGGTQAVMSDIRGGKVNTTDGNQLGYLDSYVNNGSGVTRITRLTSAGLDVTGALSATGAHTAMSGTAIPAGGTAGTGLMVSSTANFGVFFGSGAPTLSAAKGSLYLRSDGSGIADRMYVNTNGSTTWTNLVTAA